MNTQRYCVHYGAFGETTVKGPYTTREDANYIADKARAHGHVCVRVLVWCVGSGA